MVFVKKDSPRDKQIHADKNTLVFFELSRRFLKEGMLFFAM